MSTPSALLPFQPSSMTSAQLAAVSYLARYAGRTHTLYSFQLRQWFAWCEGNGLDPLVGIPRAHIELYMRQLGYRGSGGAAASIQIGSSTASWSRCGAQYSLGRRRLTRRR